jgi:hypothetical protein
VLLPVLPDAPGSVCHVIECNVRKAARLVLYVGMVFVCCQLNMGMAFLCCQRTLEWHFYFASVHRNDIFVLPNYKGMVFLFLVNTGMTFVYCQLTKECHLCVAHLHRNSICLWQVTKQ